MSGPRRLAVAAACAYLVAPASAAAQSLVPVGETFSSPVYVTAPPGDGRRLMVVEQGGTVRVVRDGVALADPFVRLSGNFTSGGERGLLSIAFRPDYERSRLLYAYYTDAEGDIRVDELRRSVASRDLVEPGYRRPVIEIAHREAANHNGGTLAFGPDGQLYMATGDGGNAYDTPNRDARSLGSLLGKVLRIAPTPGGGYTIPAGNPYTAPADPGLDEIWARGLRNPFRFSFDHPTGDLFVADVGQDVIEEVNHVPFAAGGAARGANFGWDDCEGNLAAEPVTGTAPCPLTGDVRPVLSLPQTAGYCSVIGGVVVRDPSVPQLLGRYLYGDLCKDRLRSYVPGQPATDREESALAVASPAGIGLDACGRVYVAELGGRIARLESALAGCALRVPEPTGGGGAGAPGGGAGVPGPDSGGPLSSADRTPPRLVLGGPRRQRLTRRGLLVRARCSEPCSLRALGTLSLRGEDGPVRLRQTLLRRLAAGRIAKLRLRATAGARRATARALARGRRVRALVSVRARDALGNLRSARRTVRLRG